MAPNAAIRSPRSGRNVPIWFNQQTLSSLEGKAQRRGLELNKYVKELILNSDRNERMCEELSTELAVAKALMAKLVIPAPDSSASDPRIDELQGQVYAVSEGIKILMAFNKTVLGDLGILTTLEKAKGGGASILAEANSEATSRKKMVNDLLEKFIKHEKDTLEMIQNS